MTTMSYLSCRTRSGIQYLRHVMDSGFCRNEEMENYSKVSRCQTLIKAPDPGFRRGDDFVVKVERKT